MIDCVTIPTSHHFTGNLVREQHRLRYAECIVREGWRDLYALDELEFDQYDTLATEYFVSRDETGRVVGVIRSNPTTIPYMLEECFPFLSHYSLPREAHIFEASRLVVDRTLLNSDQRAVVVNQLLVGLMERGLQRRLTEYIGFMTPHIWERTFCRIGWTPEWLGPEIGLVRSRYTVRAARVPVSQSIHERLREFTRLSEPTVLNFGGEVLSDSVTRIT